MNMPNTIKKFTKTPIFESGQPKIHKIIETKVITRVKINHIGLWVINKYDDRENANAIINQKMPTIRIPNSPR